MCDIGIHRQPRKQRNLHYIRANHHMGQPDGNGADIPEIEIRGGIQYACLQARSPGGQDTVYPEADFFRQSHVNDDRQNTEEECG